MKTLAILAGRIILAASLLSQTVTAATIFSQDFDPALIVANGQSDLSTENHRADDFSLAADAVLRTVRWLGLYLPDNSPSTDNFTVRVFADSGSNTPETNPSLLDLNVGDAVNRVDTGVIVGGNKNLYSFEATLSAGVPLLGGTTYWLSVLNDTSNDTNDNWSWGISATSGHVSAFRSFDGDPWTSQDNKFQFELASVPVPGAIWLFASGLIGMLGFAGKRQRL